VCVRVCTLTTSSSCSPDGALCGFLQQPNLRALESLTLRFIQFGQLSDDTQPMETEYAAAFASLPFLHTLTLRSAPGLGHLLPHLASSSSLRILRVGSHRLLRITSAGSYPTIEILTSLLHAAPLLHVVIEVRPCEEIVSLESQQRHAETISTYEKLAPRVEIHVKPSE
jgi:hypothetical protein